MNRRNFLGLSIGLAALSVIRPSLLYAQNAPTVVPTIVPTEGGFFVLIRVSDGMDATLGLDPQMPADGIDEKDVFIEYRSDEILQAGEIKLGPSAEPLLKYANDISIINGISMRRDAGHESLRDYLSSGKGDGLAPFIPVVLDANVKSGPFGIITSSSANPGEYNPIFTSTSDIIAAASGEASLIQYIIAANSNPHAAPFLKSMIGLSEGMKYSSAMTEVQKQVESKVSSPELLGVTMALGAGVSRNAVIQMSKNLDTHSEHEKNHMARQKEAWTDVATLFDAFKSIPIGDKTLFDHTTFMVVTEFSRTPYLNGAKGKDHNPFTNSVLLAGRGIKGNVVSGASHVISRTKTREGLARHTGLPIDYGTGKAINDPAAVNDQTNMIFPENVVRTVAAAVGAEEFFKNINSKYKVIPGIIKG